MFNLQQGKFAFCSSGISGQAAVGSHHPMAGDKDTDGVVSDGVSYRLGSHVRTSEPTGGFCGHFFVGLGFSVGDTGQDVPDGLLERGTIKTKRGKEAGLLSGKIEVEPLSGLTQDGNFFFFGFFPKGTAEILLSVKPQSAESVVRGGKGDASQGRIVVADTNHAGSRKCLGINLLYTDEKRTCVLLKM